MRLAFMGTPAFALPTLSAILKAGHKVSMVITQPDKPKGRGMHVEAPPVKDLAYSHGIPVFQPETLKGNAEILSLLQTQHPQAVVVVAYGKLIPPEMLSIPQFGFLNVHASLLPQLRGAAPINWAILSGYRTTGISIMRLDKGLDTGPVYLKAEVPITPSDDAETLADTLAEMGAAKILEVLDQLAAGTAKSTPQDESLATYAPLLKKTDGQIDWHNEPNHIVAMVRGLIPWPCAYTRMGEKMLRIYQAKALIQSHDLKPGTLVKEGQEVRIACGEGFVIPSLLQLEGKQVLPVQAFANGLRSDKIILGE